MLLGVDLPPNFWPYAFHHFVHLYNVTPYHDKTQSPLRYVLVVLQISVSFAHLAVTFTLSHCGHIIPPKLSPILTQASSLAIRIP